MPASSVPTSTPSLYPAPRTGVLASNPFFILGLTPLDDRLRIIEQAEERALHGNQALCHRARSDLTNPRTRLAFELSWFAGVPAATVDALKTSLDTHPLQAMALAPADLPPLAKANLMCAGFERIDPHPLDAARLTEALRDFGEITDQLVPSAVLKTVNSDRQVAGFPEVQELAAVDEALAQLRKQYKDVLVDLLDRMPSTMLVDVMTSLVNRATANGSKTAAALIDDLVDAYALETQALLEAERENMAKLAERALAQAGQGEAHVNALADTLFNLARHWCLIARPIQLSTKARGMSNPHSEQLAGELRELGVALFNQHGMHAVATRLTHLLMDIFAAVPRALEQLEADALRLKEIEQERLQVTQWDIEWRRAISFQAEGGLWRKHPVRIDPEGVSWQGKHLRLTDITRVRWCARQQLHQSLPVGTYHFVDVGNAHTTLSMALRSEAAYTTFVHSLWRAVCVRLMFEMAQALQAGRTLEFDTVQVRDEGVTLRPRQWLASGPEAQLTWSEVQVASTRRHFAIESKHGTSRCELSYARVWNVHVLEQLVASALHKGSPRLSDYLADPRPPPEA